MTTARQIRSDCGMKQTEMAARLAVGLRTYRRYEAEGAPEHILRHMRLLQLAIEHGWDETYGEEK